MTNVAQASHACGHGHDKLIEVSMEIEDDGWLSNSCIHVYLTIN